MIIQVCSTGKRRTHRVAVSGLYSDYRTIVMDKTIHIFIQNDDFVHSNTLDLKATHLNNKYIYGTSSALLIFYGYPIPATNTYN
ncbi:MAG: hypothetical protein PWQ75_2453 [Methanolobus sp.]|jgi:hypothetical protein|uniref:hypothetical protein n=1 Tax=Methanolobus sp. TaxID=1874737 RepID=UPI00258B9FD0|nr:hypothetical protein [Methanolobus sp.]MDK2832701.1 hypothetical protein [Methanolobus sp.]